MSNQTETFDPIPETVAEALAKWDAGQTVFTVEMGGIGPGYEMAIQGLVFEMLRRVKDEKFPPLGEDFADADKDRINRLLDEVVHEQNGKPWAGFSGAQVGAAKSLVACIMRRGGYRIALRDPEVQDRLIQVSKKDLRQ